MTLSVLILMTVLFINAAVLEFSSFPTILLIATMLRLSLNMASTRLILADGPQRAPTPPGPGDPGLRQLRHGRQLRHRHHRLRILVIVNFVVITKGSGRIAEVSARFTLDAMPGKQMAIDADLSTGLIDEETERPPAAQGPWRTKAAFYGAMDGAAKFVRGDAIAGLLITFINVIGGIIIGVGQKDLVLCPGQRHSLHPADRRRRPGDSQIPALIVSDRGRPAGLQGRRPRDSDGTSALFRQMGELAPRRSGCVLLPDGRPRPAARHALAAVHVAASRSAAGWRCLVDRQDKQTEEARLDRGRNRSCAPSSPGRAGRGGADLQRSLRSTTSAWSSATACCR